MFNRYAWQQQQHFLQPPFRFWSSLKTETCFILIVSLQCDEPRNSWRTAGGYQRRSPVQCTLGYYVFLTGWTANKIPVLHEQALPACRARWLWVGLSALLSLLTFQVILVWETGENLYLLKTTKVCVWQGGKGSSAKSGTMHFSTSHLPGASSPAPEWLPTTGTLEALCRGEGPRRPKQIKTVAQRHTLSLTSSSWNLGNLKLDGLEFAKSMPHEMLYFDWMF